MSAVKRMVTRGPFQPRRTQVAAHRSRYDLLDGIAAALVGLTNDGVTVLEASAELSLAYLFLPLLGGLRPVAR